ncbi:hypothetical protein OE88DRAFT_425641 [Heliocybe sulcata]|uniref:Uncharacterized protein n=1 Tax=Heliocybe sulcata TaxID=5364 RepID=A0A5C3N6M6_9AGAM|nr:hypothetical protein OE88DRAFT_425641 [Heliocybe sulcata]
MEQLPERYTGEQFLASTVAIVDLNKLRHRECQARLNSSAYCALEVAEEVTWCGQMGSWIAYSSQARTPKKCSTNTIQRNYPTTGPHQVRDYTRGTSSLIQYSTARPRYVMIASYFCVRMNYQCNWHASAAPAMPKSVPRKKNREPGSVDLRGNLRTNCRYFIVTRMIRRCQL